MSRRTFPSPVPRPSLDGQARTVLALRKKYFQVSVHTVRVFHFEKSRPHKELFSMRAEPVFFFFFFGGGALS